MTLLALLVLAPLRNRVIASPAAPPSPR